MKIRVLLVACCLMMLLASRASADIDVAGVAEKAKLAIVTVTTFEGSEEAAQGSGFLIDETHVVTCYHVIAQNARATVKTADGKSYKVKEVVASNPTVDLVRLSLADPVSGAKPLALARSLPKQGEKIVVVGSPMGLDFTVSDGIVSAMRVIPGVGTVLQITAPVSPGSSGSPVLNLSGEVVGVVTSYLAKGQNLNFAVSSEQVLALKTLAKPDPSKVSLKADAMPAADAFVSLAAQSGCKILLESSVKGKVTAMVTDVPLDTALSAVCKSTNLVWRRVYIDPKSELLDKPDRFAATLRLMAGLSFPDLVIAGSSNNKIGVHCQQKQGVEDAQDKIVKDLGMAPIYLVSNDALVAAKEAAKNTAVSKYTDMAKKQLEMFMDMKPEEREQALLESLSLMDNMGPEYYSSVMQTMMNSNPETLQRIQKRGTDMLFSMSTEQRRQMMRMNMKAMSGVTPEQMQILQEDAKAIAEEMKNEQPQPVP